MAFEEKFTSRTVPSKPDSHMQLSMRLTMIAKKLMPQMQANSDSVYGVFLKKIQLMSQAADKLSYFLDVQVPKNKFWAFVFARVVDESLPYSRDGTIRLLQRGLSNTKASSSSCQSSPAPRIWWKKTPQSNANPEKLLSAESTTSATRLARQRC